MDTVSKKKVSKKGPLLSRSSLRNIRRFKRYEHAHSLKLLKNRDKTPDSSPKSENVYREELEILKRKIDSIQDNMLQKWNSSAPYHLFFTEIPKIPDTAKQNAITFTDLLCPSLGKLKTTLQMSFMLDIKWLINQYDARSVNSLPMTVLYGSEYPDNSNMETYMDQFLKQVTYHRMEMPDAYGKHHSKIGIYLYDDDSLRVVVSTANLYFGDWNNYNQELWVSPLCPPISNQNNGESITNFKSDLLSYLRTYNVACLEPWIKSVQNVDFSEIKVFLVTSTPGIHYPDDNGSHVHTIAKLLKTHCDIPTRKTEDRTEQPADWAILAQSSAIGSLGRSAGEWLRTTILRSLAAHKNASLTTNPDVTIRCFKFIYPTVKNVMSGVFGEDSGGCLPYADEINEEQGWFQDYLYQWKADKSYRSRTMPHMKTYTRVSPCLSKLAYFLLTSANLSRSAWGGCIQSDQGVYVRSYEAGVLFLPQFFNEKYFEITRTPSSKNSNLFPFMYDLPLIPYENRDYPFTT